MLHLQVISGPQDQHQLFEQFDPHRGSWIVSDLKTKLDLQRVLIQKNQFIHGNTILRASELWRFLLNRLRPEFQVISRELAITWISEQLRDHRFVWARTPGAATTAYNYLCQLMPVLSHPQSAEMMSEWFSSHPESQMRWSQWFELSTELWQGFLRESWVAAPWVSGVLVNETGFEQVWKQPLIFDLGAELNQVEADLISVLATHVPITVIQPRPIWSKEYRRTLHAYGLLEQKPRVKQTFFSSGSNPKQAPRDYVKLTTMLAEVKNAVAQVRSWLDQGTRASDIAIVAPDIEVYWPSLSAYLEVEGVPVQKPRVTKLHSFHDVGQWLARLRLKLGGFDRSDLEVSTYSEVQDPTLPFDRFRIFYSSIYSRDDLNRVDTIQEAYLSELKSLEVVPRDRFVGWAIKSLSPATSYERVESLLKRVFQDCAESVHLTALKWLELIEEFAAKTEVAIRPGETFGVACLNLVSAENSEATHMILMGLTESGLRQGAETAILFSDILSLSDEFGFHLQASDLAKLEFEARWIIENADRSLLLSTPETDFDGAVQAPSWLWVRGALQTDDLHALEVKTPKPTRWDELQAAGIANIALERGWQTPHRERLIQSFEQDLGLRPLENFAVGRVQTVSASSIEDYLQCPFIFAAKILFHLSDYPNLDLDLDAATRGQLMHALFERLTREPMRFDLDQATLEAEVDLAREQATVQIYDERLWSAQRQRWVKVAKRFLDFEKEWRQRFPQTLTLDREVSLRGFIDIETGQMKKQASTQSIAFRGSIDRLDTDGSGHVSVIDYKSSATELSQWSQWLTRDQLQLILYSMAFEQGLSAHRPQEVVSAVYFVAREFDRDRGFKLEGVEQGLFDVEDRKKNKMDQQQKQRLFEQTQEILSRVLKRMKAGEFQPVPKDTTICKTCEWSFVCRAPHLNI